MGLISRMLGIQPVGKLALAALKKKAFEPYGIPIEKAMEKQGKMMEAKFSQMEGTKIGRKLGIRKRVTLGELPVTGYDFYAPFYNNPSPSCFMYPLKEYLTIKTSGTAGREKLYLRPRKMILKSFLETGIPAIFAGFHDGEKVTLEYGDNFYVNMGPAPFAAGSTFSLVAREGKIPFFNIVPNVNLPYKDKVQYFILNYDKIDAAIMLSSTLISQIMPAIGKPIELKGLLMPDTPDIEVYREEIERFTGAIPRTAYASTETISCSVPSVQHSLGFFFDLRRGCFEFAPVRRGNVADDEFVPINEVSVGEIYRLIYTDFYSEITRFDTKDSFKCIAKGDNVLNTDYPIFKYEARLDKTISLQNFTRMSEEEILKAFREAGIEFREFTARVEIEGGLEHMAIYLEPVGTMSTEKIKNAMHNQLCKIDEDYRSLAEFFEYIPLKVHLVPSGVFARYLQGKTGSIAKVDRICMSEEEFAKLLGLMKKTRAER